MKRKWQLPFSLTLVGLSVLLYLLHYLLFRDSRTMFFYLFQDLAFVPISVLLVTLIVNRLLVRQEKEAMMNKLNMVIGAFFSEVGCDLLGRLTAFDPDGNSRRAELLISDTWTADRFDEAARRVLARTAELDSRRGSLAELRDRLAAKRSFLVQLIENPSVLEHAAFTDLMWSVFHLMEELTARPSMEGLPDSDYRHLSGDMTRAHGRLLSEWLMYLKHLRRNYPYLFSLAVRTNPMDPRASPIVPS